jgi:hypothetical protein
MDYEILNHITTSFFGEYSEIAFKVFEVALLISASLVGYKELRGSRLERTIEFSNHYVHKWDSSKLRVARAKIAKLVIDSIQKKITPNFSHPIIKQEVIEILNFYEITGDLIRKGALDKNFTWGIWSEDLAAYKPYLQLFVTAYRKKTGDNMFFENFDFLVKTFEGLDKRHVSKLNEDISHHSTYVEDLGLTYRFLIDSDLEEFKNKLKYWGLSEKVKLKIEEINEEIFRVDNRFLICESIDQGIIAFLHYGYPDEEKSKGAVQLANFAINPLFQNISEIYDDFLEVLYEDALNKSIKKIFVYEAADFFHLKDRIMTQAKTNLSELEIVYQ